MCQFCTLIFLLKLINFLKKDFPRRGPVFCQGGGGRPPAPVLATPLSMAAMFGREFLLQIYMQLTVV